MVCAAEELSLLRIAPDGRTMAETRPRDDGRLSLTVAEIHDAQMCTQLAQVRGPRAMWCNCKKTAARCWSVRLRQLVRMTTWFAARDSPRAKLQSIGVVFGRCGVVCRASSVGRGAEACAAAFVSFNGRFFRMRCDVRLQPGELVHRIGFRSSLSHAVGFAHAATHQATSLCIAGMDLPFQPALSRSCDGQP
ncbi:hypothetical protein BER93_02595 [Xanthomonas fragariae]|nr:hypothetical protein BER92_02590 [Xanthomonas fragariae]AOD17203.1 hypothetical protein BER93_02595 [Xanthomonas fragariae]